MTDLGDPASAIFDALTRAPSALITGPIGADGDSLGASLALAHVLRRRGHMADVTGATGRRYAFIPGADRLLSDETVGSRAERDPWHTVVVVDGDRHRLTPGVRRAWDKARVRGVVDHHKSTDTEGYDIAWLDGQATSTCHMIWTALQARNEPLDTELATLLHTGSLFDTGGLRFENTTPTVLRAAADFVHAGAPHAEITRRMLHMRRWRGVQALGRVLSRATLLSDGQLATAMVTADLMRELDLVRDDLEGIVDHLLFVDGVQVAALLIEQSDHIKVSLRSRGEVDVAALAARLAPSGGGHSKAAGARSPLSPAEIELHLQAAVGSVARQPHSDST